MTGELVVGIVGLLLVVFGALVGWAIRVLGRLQQSIVDLRVAMAERNGKVHAAVDVAIRQHVHDCPAVETTGVHGQQVRKVEGSQWV